MKDNSFEIRKAVLDDLEELTQLRFLQQHDDWGADYEDIDNNFYNRTFVAFKNLIANELGVIFIAEKDNEIVAKSWIREDGVYYLYKESNNAVGEELASSVLDMLGVDHVSYTKVEDSGFEITKCRCFTSEDVGFIPYRTLVKEMGENALDYVKNTYMEDFANLAVCSYLIGNEDLHDKNWGFLINSDGNIIGMAPMFDFRWVFCSL